MRVAALYDVHANLHALDAVLADLGREQIDLVVVGGDVVWGPMPQETMDRLRSLDVETEWILGNADRDVFDRVEGRWKETNDWCADRLDEDHLAFLRGLPATITIDDVCFCHGSPRSDLDPITTATTEEQVLEWCSGVTQRTVVCGHTHAQFDRRVRELRVVNAGSVGNPFGEPGAYWAIFDSDVELRHTSYDVRAAAEACRRSGFPAADLIAPQVARPGPASLAAELFTR